MAIAENEIAPRQTWIKTWSAVLIWWICPLMLPVLLAHGVLNGLLLACAFGYFVSIFFCARFRSEKWSALVWIPMFAWILCGMYVCIHDFLFAGLKSHGWTASADEFIGIIGILICCVPAAVCWLVRPRYFSTALVCMAVLNTVAVSLATRQVYRFLTKQGIIVHILDSAGNPLPGASVSFERYGYGNWGTSVFDGKGGPIYSDASGTVVMPSRQMRFETKATISKPGFRQVNFTLGMQYDKWDELRDVNISTPQTHNIARGFIPTTDPLTFSIYLPRQSEGPDPLQPVRHMETKSFIGDAPMAANYLNVETGRFNPDPSGDLYFYVYPEKDADGINLQQRLLIKGINGTKNFQGTPSVSLTGNLTPFEQMFRIAPQKGYQEDIVARDGDIYVSARNGKLYVRMTVETFIENRERTRARCLVNLYVNPTGSRELE